MLSGYALVLVRDPGRLLIEIRPPPDTLAVVLSSVRNAIEVVSYVIPAAVLVEDDLSDGRGLDLVEVMKDNSRLRDVPVILLGMDDLLLYQWLGIDAFVPGGWDVRAVNRILGGVNRGELSIPAAWAVSGAATRSDRPLKTGSR